MDAGVSVPKSKCTECRLHETAEFNCLLGQGPRRSKVMVVGEAPGKREDNSGKPFVGKSGQLLDDILEEVGLPREEVYVTNAVHCRPPDNRTPTKGEVNKCKQWLDHEIKKVKPKFILLLGNTPLLSITGKQGIRKLRGKPIEEDGILYFPTYHPAYCIRDTRHEPVLRGDLKLFAQIVKRGGARKQEGLNYRIIEDGKTLRRAIRDIRRNSFVSLDTETSGLYPFAPGSWVTSLGIGTERYQWCLPLQHHLSSRRDKFKLQRKVVRQMARAIKGRTTVAHGGKFDAKFLRQIYGVRVHIDFDTLLAHYSLNENALHSLDALSQQHFDAIDYDIPLEEKWGITGTLERHCEYLALDCFYTRKLYPIFRRELRKDPETRKVFEKLTMPVSRMYTDVEHLGIYVDPKALKQSHKYWTRKADRSMAQLNRLVPDDREWKNKKTGEICKGINWGSSQQVGEVLFDRLGLEPLDKTPKGANSTSESVLLRLADKHKVPKLILKNREATKNLSTFVTSWQKWCVNSRMHCSFKIHGTVTGRPSCEDPNLQQTPRDPRIRGMITAPPGRVLIDADFSQVELRVTADLSQDRSLLFAYQTGGIDVHTQTVQNIFGIATPTKEERKKGKAINFGFIYGMGWRKFMEYARDNYQQVFSEAESKRIRKEFFKLYGDLTAWHGKQRRYANRYGYVRNLIGRKRRLPEAIPKENQSDDHWDPQQSEAERQAINSPVQSFASDMNLMAAVEIHDTLSHKECRIVGTVHDSILMEVREDKVQAIALKVKRIMERPKLIDEFGVDLSIPIIAEIEAGPWSKGEEIHFDKDS